MTHWTQRLVSMVAGLLLLAAGGLGPTGSVTPSDAAGTLAASRSTQTLLALACPSVTNCYAVGNHGTILATHDGGATWRGQTSRTQDPISRIACPTAGVCFALANPRLSCGPVQIPLLRTTDGGRSWRRTALPLNCPGPGPSCPSVTTCYVFGSCVPAQATCTGKFVSGNPELYRTTNGGKRWEDRGRTPNNTTSGENTSGIGVQSISCPTLTVCYAGGEDQLARSTDGGKHWTRWYIYVAPCPRADVFCHVLNQMACPSERLCYAGGTSAWGGNDSHAPHHVTAVVVATTDGFRTWQRSVIKSFHGLMALSCPTPASCFALGGNYPAAPYIGSTNETGRFAMTADHGTTWRVRRIAPYSFTDLACPSVSVCYAAGYLGRLMRSSNGGATWHDLLPAVFAAGRAQSQHASSPWFTASHPWHLTLGLFFGPTSPSHDGHCLPKVYVRDHQGHVVAGPLRIPRVNQMEEPKRYETTLSVTGKVRVNVTSGCSAFVLRIDGVK